MAYTVSESDFFSPSPAEEARINDLLARIIHRGSALAALGSALVANSASKDLGVPVSR